LQKIEEENRREEKIDEEPWQRKGKYKEKKKVNVREAVRKLEKEREEEEQAKREKEEDDTWFEEIKRKDKEMEGFWDAMKEEEMKKEEEKPIVVVAMPKKTNGKKRR